VTRICADTIAAVDFSNCIFQEGEQRSHAVTASTQGEHDRKWSFEQEFMTLLKKSGRSTIRNLVFG